MGRVEFFDHTADLGLRVIAADRDELFRDMAQGLFDVIVANRDSVAAVERQTVALKADSPQALLVSWLNELIYRAETSHILFSRFEVQVASDGSSLTAEIAGEPIDLDRHVLDHEVKAVTHHGLVLTRHPEGWLAEVILDI